MASKFDPSVFLNTSIKGSNATKIKPVPEDEYTLIGHKIDLKTPKDNVILDVIFEVDSEIAREATGMKCPTVRFSCFLDLNKDGFLDMGEGRNVQLGRLREALGQNDPDMEWTPHMIVGAVCRGKIVHRQNDDDPESPYTDVKQLTRL